MAVDVGEARNRPSRQPHRACRRGNPGVHGFEPAVFDLDQNILSAVSEPRLIRMPATEAVHCIGMWPPRSLATSIARSYPASACRMTPVPGSLVSTRSSLRAASAVPSAPTTIPACIERPMPTPPPWCTLTHDAPLEVLRRALRIGQSAIASEPSRIASVSRYGEATEPESRWSRPITIGALTAPVRTISLMRRPAPPPPPYPTHQLRAGNPCNHHFPP